MQWFSVGRTFWKLLALVMKIVERQRPLLQVVRTLHPPRSLTSGLNAWEQQSNKYPNNSNCSLYFIDGLRRPYADQTNELPESRIVFRNNS